MKNKYLSLALISSVLLLTISCGSDEEQAACETNTKFNFSGSSENWCGRSEFRQYSYNATSDEEFGNIFIRYPAGNVSVHLSKKGKFTVGDVYTYGNGLGLSGDVGSVESALLTITKIDRDLELISLHFDFDYMANSNLTHWDVAGTITDLSLKVE